MTTPRPNPNPIYDTFAPTALRGRVAVINAVADTGAMDFRVVDIEPDHAVADFGEAQREGQSDIAQAEDADGRRALVQAPQQRFLDQRSIL